MKSVKKQSSQNLSHTSEGLYDYDTIPLKVYIQIASTGKLELLLIKGENKTLEVYTEQWESIVKRNSDTTGTFDYDEYFQLLKSYALLMVDYTLSKALLISLSFNIDYEKLQKVRSLGYRIDTSNTLTYTTSLTNALRKCENLNTKLVAKRKEIDLLFKDAVKNKTGFEEIIANLNYQLGFNVNEDITLARFNEYKKILNRKRKQNERIEHGS